MKNNKKRLIFKLFHSNSPTCPNICLYKVYTYLWALLSWPMKYHDSFANFLLFECENKKKTVTLSDTLFLSFFTLNSTCLSICLFFNPLVQIMSNTWLPPICLPQFMNGQKRFLYHIKNIITFFGMHNTFIVSVNIPPK